MSAYTELFKDPRWQKMRLKILERDEFHCQICGDGESTLHVHHRYYESGCKPWEYEESALVTLCEECHQSETESIKDSCEMLIKSMKEKCFSGDILAFGIDVHYMKPLYPPSVIFQAFSSFLLDVRLQKKVMNIHFNNLKDKRILRERKNAKNKIHKK